MKNITNGLLWFAAGVAITLIFTKGIGKKLIQQLESLPADEPVTVDDIEQSVKRVENEFKKTHNVE